MLNAITDVYNREIQSIVINKGDLLTSCYSHWFNKHLYFEPIYVYITINDIWIR